MHVPYERKILHKGLSLHYEMQNFMWYLFLVQVLKLRRKKNSFKGQWFVERVQRKRN